MWLTNVGAIAGLDAGNVLPMHFLLISNEMLDSGNDTLSLEALDSFSGTNGLQYRIRTESFPVSATFGLAANGTDSWAKPDVHAFASSFLANSDSSLVHKAFIKGSTDSNSVWKYGNIVCLPNAIGSIIQAQLWKTHSERGASITIAATNNIG